MVSNGYAEVDHTADLAINVWGEDFLSILIHSAQGMYALIGVRCDMDSPTTITFSIEDADQETILVDFLSELLYLCEDRRLAFDIFTFNFQIGRIIVSASGHNVIAVHRDIKAVTFNDLVINRTDSGLETMITFDV